MIWESLDLLTENKINGIDPEQSVKDFLKASHLLPDILIPKVSNAIVDSLNKKLSGKTVVSLLTDKLIELNAADSQQDEPSEPDQKAA